MRIRVALIWLLGVALTLQGCSSLPPSPERKPAMRDKCADLGFSATNYITLADWAAKTGHKLTMIYFPGDEVAVHTYVDNNGASGLAHYQLENCSNRDELSKLETCDLASDGSVIVFYVWGAKPLECRKR